MQKAIIVTFDRYKGAKRLEEASNEAVGELNQHLLAGWKVNSMCSGGDVDGQYSVYLVLLEKPD